MARISTYAIDPNLTPEDKLHGSDENNVTRNFNLGPTSSTSGGGGGGSTYITNNIVTYITECDSRALAFLYHSNTYNGNATPQEATIVANNESSNAATFGFNQVTSLLVSKLPYAAALAAASSHTCINIMNELVGEKIIWSNIYNPDQYGIYQCTSWAVDATFPNHYNMGLTHLSSNGILDSGPDPLLYMVEVWGGGDKTFTHDQTVSASSWTITHGLGKYPAVQIETSGNVNGYGEVIHNTNNQLTINFSAPYTGKVHCN